MGKAVGKRYAIYLRCSTDDQAQGDFTTIDAQRIVNTKYVVQQGGVIAGEYADEGRSGTNLKRPKWKDLLADAEAGKFDRVCATYMSRLGRGDACAVAEYLLGETGVQVEYVNEKFTNDTAGYINRQITRFVDGMKVEEARQHTKTKMEQMVAAGYYCGGTLPLGYKAEPITHTPVLHSSDKEPPKRLVIDEEQAEIVRFAFDLFLDRGTIAAVRDYLKGVTSRNWTTFTTKYLLRNPVYLGVLEFGNWRNDSAHPAIIDNETWEAVQERLEASPHKHSRAPISDSYTYYLRGLVVCPHCGCSYTNGAAKGGKVRYYQCLHDSKSMRKCPVGRVNAEALHNSVLKEISRASRHWTVMHKIIAESGGWQGIDETKKALRGQLSRKKQFAGVGIARIVSAVEKGHESEALLSRLAALEKEDAELGCQIDQLDVEIAMSKVARPTAAMVQAEWARVPELWDALSEGERTELLSSIVREVVVNAKDRVSLKLSPIAEVHGLKFATTEKMGAGARSVGMHQLCLLHGW